MNHLKSVETSTVKSSEELIEPSADILSSDMHPVNEQVKVKPSWKRTKKQDRVAKKPKIELTCGICLDEIKGKNAGKPSGCSHTFCVKCITKWAKAHDTCPFDRIQFNFLTIIDKETGEQMRQIKKKEKKTKTFKSRTRQGTERSESNLNLNPSASRAERMPPNPVLNPFSNFNPSHCKICMSYEHQDMMISCDTCVSRFHIECLSNANDVQAHEWSCRTCRSLGRSGSNEQLRVRNSAVRSRVLQHYRAHNQVLFVAGNGSALANISSGPLNANQSSAAKNAASTAVNISLPQQRQQLGPLQSQGLEAAQPRDFLFEIMRSQEMLFGRIN